MNKLRLKPLTIYVKFYNMNYTLLKESITILHPETKLPLKLYRIISNVKITHGSLVVPAGTIGGYVQSTENLSEDENDSSWIGHTAMVFDRAKVTGNAFVISKAAVYGDSVITGNSMIKGTSHISGKSIVEASVIDGNVDVKNSKILDSRLQNSALIIDSVLTKSNAADGAYVLNSKMFQCSVAGTSQCINSNADVCYFKNSGSCKDVTVKNTTFDSQIELNIQHETPNI